MKSLKKYAVIVLLCAATLFITVPTIGCNEQQSAAQLVEVLGSAVASLGYIEGTPQNLITQVENDTQVAASFIASWKSGTPAQDVIAALNAVESDLYLFPISSEDQALIDLAIGTVEEIMTLVSPSSSAVQAQNRSPRIVPASRSIHNRKDFKASWNGLIGSNAKLAPALIK